MTYPWERSFAHTVRPRRSGVVIIHHRGYSPQEPPRRALQQPGHIAPPRAPMTHNIDWFWLINYGTSATLEAVAVASNILSDISDDNAPVIGQLAKKEKKKSSFHLGLTKMRS